MRNINCDKMILAVLQGEDYQETIQELNEHGFYVTKLHSSGGFLKKPSATVMIGLNHEYLNEAMELLKRHGERMEQHYRPSGIGSPVSPFVSIPVHCGGVTLFVLDVEQHKRF